MAIREAHKGYATTVYRQASFDGEMRKHSTYRAERIDKGLAALNAAAHSKVEPAIRGEAYAVRVQGKGGRFYLIHRLPVRKS